MKKRLLSLFAAFCLIAAMAPAPVRADDNEAGTDTPNENTVAKVGDAYYTSLDTAIVAAAGDETVELFLGADNSAEKLDLEGRVNVANSVTLDLSEKEVDVCFGDNPGIYISGAAAKVTIQNGTINCAEPNAYGAVYVSANSSSAVALEDIYIFNKSGGPAIILASSAGDGVTLTVGEDSEVSNKSDKTEISTDQSAISNFGKATINVLGKVSHVGTFAAINGAWSENDQYTTDINVAPGAVVSQTQTESDPQGAGILMMSRGTVKISGEVSGYSGVDMTLGNLIVEAGATISGVGPYHDNFTSSGDWKVYEDGSAIFIDPAGATSVTVNGGTLKSTHGHAVSARDVDNQEKGLSIAISGGTLIGTKSALAVNDLTGVVSGGAFSSSVDDDLLSDEVKFAAKKADGDARYSYHKTLSEAREAAGEDGEFSPVGDADGTPSDFFRRVDSLKPAEGGTKADIISITKTDGGVYEIKLGGTATPSHGGAPESAYWIGVGIAPPEGCTSVAYAAGDYSKNKDIAFHLNNGDGSLDDIQKGDTNKGFAIWLDAAEVGEEGIYYTAKWSGAEKPDNYEVYHFIWSGKLRSDTPPEPGTYKITIASGITNGTVTADPTTAKEGDTVTLTITPNSGYSLSTISTTPKLDLVGSGNTRTFTMPESDVTVSATFAANSTSTRLTGTVIIDGWPWVGETLTARVRNTNNTGRLYYQWTADGYNLWGETSPEIYLTDYTYGKVIRCVVTSSVQTGSITGRLSETVGHYNGRYYPTESPANSSGTNQSGTNQSGNAEGGNDFTFDTPLLTTATNADGTKTTTIIEPDGSSGLVMLTNYGTVSSASMTFSSSAFANALRTGSALVVPTSVQSSRSAGSAAPVRIVLPQTVGSVKVKIPVSKMTAGTVAVMENYFGPDTVVRSSVSESDGVVFRLTGSAVVKIVDNSRSFQDVSGGEWYANAVNWASSREVMNGVSAKMFDPQGTVNRAMMTQMLYNFDGAEYTGATAQFSDVSSGNWYAASVSWATRNQIARNYGNRFGAEDALTREDMAAMLYHYARLKGYGTYASGSLSAFSDNGSVSDWARPAMQWAVGAGLITGTQNGTRTVVLDPQGTVTRAQLATIMQRFNNLY